MSSTRVLSAVSHRTQIIKSDSNTQFCGIFVSMNCLGSIALLIFCQRWPIQNAHVSLLHYKGTQRNPSNEEGGGGGK